MTGHRSESSVTRYCRKRKDSLIREMSYDLAEGLQEKRSASATVMDTNHYSIENLSQSTSNTSCEREIHIHLNGHFEGCTFTFPNNAASIVKNN